MVSFFYHGFTERSRSHMVKICVYLGRHLESTTLQIISISVIIDVGILNILGLKELDGIWHPKFDLKMKWFDTRLVMQNLKDEKYLNVLASNERDKPWIPAVIFNNHESRERVVMDDNTDLFIVKEGKGHENSLGDIDNAELFLGEENPFDYKRSYSFDLECSFNLQSYPFDSQQCLIELRVPFAMRESVKLEANKIYFDTVVGTQVDLPQFEVVASMAVTEEDVVYFIVIFQRKISYHLISVYIPSMSLLMVSLATLHISVEHFEANIMVHLTTMLVMYTLFQAISLSLPKVGVKSIPIIIYNNHYFRLLISS